MLEMLPIVTTVHACVCWELAYMSNILGVNNAFQRIKVGHSKHIVQ